MQLALERVKYLSWSCSLYSIDELMNSWGEDGLEKDIFRERRKNFDHLPSPTIVRF